MISFCKNLLLAAGLAGECGAVRVRSYSPKPNRKTLKVQVLPQIGGAAKQVENTTPKSSLLSKVFGTPKNKVAIAPPGQTEALPQLTPREEESLRISDHSVDEPMALPPVTRSLSNNDQAEQDDFLREFDSAHGRRRYSAIGSGRHAAAWQYLDALDVSEEEKNFVLQMTGNTPAATPAASRQPSPEVEEAVAPKQTLSQEYRKNWRDLYGMDSARRASLTSDEALRQLYPNASDRYQAKQLLYAYS